MKYKQIWYNGDGSKRSEGFYRKEKKIGKWIFYYPSGNVCFTGNFNRKGTQIGKWECFYEDGKFKQFLCYIKGKECSERFYHNNKNIFMKFLNFLNLIK